MIVFFAASPSNAVKRFDLATAAVDRINARGTRAVLVHLTGQDSSERVATLMRATDVLVITSDSEGSSTVMKEALASGLPVVSVDVGDARAALKDFPDCHVTSRDPDDIAAAAVHSVRNADNERIRQLGGRYLADTAARHVTDVYRHLIGLSPNHPEE